MWKEEDIVFFPLEFRLADFRYSCPGTDSQSDLEKRKDAVIETTPLWHQWRFLRHFLLEKKPPPYYKVFCSL